MGGMHDDWIKDLGFYQGVLPTAEDQLLLSCRISEWPASDNKQKPSNEVSVGLRVYSKGLEVSIKLVKPKDPEEEAVLDADGSAPAGATM